MYHVVHLIPFFFLAGKENHQLLAPELKSISNWITIIVLLEKLWKLYDLLYSTLKQLKQSSYITFVKYRAIVIAELGQKCFEVAPTLKYEPLNNCITVLSVWIMKIFQCYASKHL